LLRGRPARGTKSTPEKQKITGKKIIENFIENKTKRTKSERLQKVSLLGE